MNHLKHILGMNVPRCPPSNAASPSGQHADLYLKSRQFRSLQSSRLDSKRSLGIKFPGQLRQDGMRLVSKGSKTICKQRSKSSAVSLKKTVDKRLPLEYVEKTARRYCTYENVKFNSSGLSKRHIPQSIAMINGTKAMRNRDSSSVVSVEKHPRSYAEMIADYSENIYKGSAMGILNDGFRFNIRKSPFSTVATPSLRKKIADIDECHEVSAAEQGSKSTLAVDTVKLFGRHTQYDSINASQHGDFKRYDTLEISNKDINHDCANNSKSMDQSYAKLIDDCSRSVRKISVVDVSNDGSALKRNENSFECLAILTGKANNANVSEISEVPAVAASGKIVKEQTVDPEKDNLLKEVESAINELKIITQRKTARTVNISKLKEDDTLLFGERRINSPRSKNPPSKDIDVHIHEETDAAIKKASHRYIKNDKSGRYKREPDMQEHNYSQFSDKSSHLPRYFSDATKTSASFAKKYSTQIPTGNSGSILKQPQVELRMVPSEKESVVSINVDSAPIGLSSDPLNIDSKQLSVVVQSDPRRNSQSTDARWNDPTNAARRDAPRRGGDFGPMRISISEDSAPVKQIEFSINGKPVSELRSITARAEKLDVVSSADKIEIRIPFTEDSAHASGKSRAADYSSQGTEHSNLEQVLNVQISANFQHQPIKGNAERPYKTISTSPTSPSQIPNTHYVFKNYAPVNERKGDVLANDEAQQTRSSNRMDIKTGDIIQKSINKQGTTARDEHIKIQNETAGKLSDDRPLTDPLSIGKMKSPKVVRSNSNIMMKDKTRPPSDSNNYEKDESADHRIPSKMVPWWSSSNSFNKIRKKKDGSKPITSRSNIADRKARPNSIQRRIVKSLTPELKGISNASKKLTKKSQSVNKASIITNNPRNMTNNPRFNSLQQGDEYKPTVYYSSILRSKPNLGNLATSETTRNELKKQDSRTSLAKTDIEKSSEIKGPKSSALSISGMKNTQGEYRANVKSDTHVRKTSALPRTFDAPSSAQFDLQSDSNRKNGDDRVLKQIRSIGDLSNTKSRVKGIPNTVKPIEKKQDGTLIDYGLRVSSRKSTLKLTSAVKPMENSPAISKTTNLMSKKPTIEMISKKEQIKGKTVSEKRSESSNVSSRVEITNEIKKLEVKTNISKEKEDVVAKNIVKPEGDVTRQNNVKNNSANKYDVGLSSLPNFNNLSKQIQMTRKQEELTGAEIAGPRGSRQYLKPSKEFNKTRSNDLSCIKASLEKMQVTKPEKLQRSVKTSKVLKEDKSRSLSSIRNHSGTTEIRKSEQLRKLMSLKESNQHSLKDSTKVVDQRKSQFENSNEVQRKSTGTNNLSVSQREPNTAAKPKNNTASKSSIDKNAAVASQSAKESVKRAGVENTTVKTVQPQGPTSRNTLSDCEKDIPCKSNKDRRNPSGSTVSPKKLSGPAGLKSYDSETRMKSRITTHGERTYAVKSLFIERSYASRDMQDGTLSKPRPSIFEATRNLNDVDGVLSRHASDAIGNVGSWRDIDRPEKNMLYSVWLQRSTNDITNNERLF